MNPPITKINKELYKKGWWLQVSPLARINPEEWIVGVLRKGKASWITEVCKSGHLDPYSAIEWGKQWIEEYEEKKKN
tara:strand:+ start:760 stop:990 length:231 start_codon:yes stop_codon:yes gene_type:complete